MTNRNNIFWHAHDGPIHERDRTPIFGYSDTKNGAVEYAKDHFLRNRWDTEQAHIYKVRRKIVTPIEFMDRWSIEEDISYGTASFYGVSVLKNKDSIPHITKRTLQFIDELFKQHEIECVSSDLELVDEPPFIYRLERLEREVKKIETEVEIGAFLERSKK